VILISKGHYRIKYNFSTSLKILERTLKQNVDKLHHYLQIQIEIRKQLKNVHGVQGQHLFKYSGKHRRRLYVLKTVLNTEFHGEGIKRFGDITPPEGMPPLSEEDKKLIIHVELPILEGRILMATDAPESMGLKVEYGTNIHINLEPGTKEETKRLFEALSMDGNVTMELQDMFWGAYYGSCTDKYGINRIFNFTNPST